MAEAVSRDESGASHRSNLLANLGRCSVASACALDRIGRDSSRLISQYLPAVPPNLSSVN
jgi:hypothetical protein